MGDPGSHAIPLMGGAGGYGRSLAFKVSFLLFCCLLVVCTCGNIPGASNYTSTRHRHQAHRQAPPPLTIICLVCWRQMSIFDSVLPGFNIRRCDGVKVPTKEPEGRHSSFDLQKEHSSFDLLDNPGFCFYRPRQSQQRLSPVAYLCHCRRENRNTFFSEKLADKKLPG